MALGMIDGRKTFLSALFVSLLGCPLLAAEGARSGGGSAGVSEAFLVRLGSSAVPYMVERMDDKRYSGEHAALAHRIATLGVGDDSRVAAALDRFARKALVSVQKSSATEVQVCDALVAIGRRGGASGVELLRHWLGNNKLPERSRYVPKVSDSHLQCAIRGLAVNAHPFARLDLRHMLERPPTSDAPKVIELAIREAIGRN